jgi:hypothetical protein
VVADVPVMIRYEPLEYQLARYHDRLSMRIINPTEDRIMLAGNRSYVVDPRGESHPFNSRVIAPHSYTQFLLPPLPITYSYPDYWAWGPGWGWGWGWGWHDPFWSPYYGPGFYGPPPVATYQIITPYNWDWKTGPARLRLTYDRNGKDFEHDFEFVREPRK